MFSFIYKRSGRFKLDICSPPRTEHPDLEGFCVPKLIIQITLTLIFLDSVISAHLISQFAPVTNNLISSYSLIKEIEILHQIIDHSKFAPRCLKRTSVHSVICTYRKLKGLSVCYKTFLGVLKVITSNIYFRDQHHLPLKAFVMWLILM